ncbi:MAG: hypothetical protein V4515_12770 [Chloroflexota bacterium]
MADSLADGNTRVAYAPSIASATAPTVAELNAGILLQSIITPDGLIGFEPDTADVPTGALNSVYSTVDIGRDSFSGTMLRLKKQTTGDTTYTTLGQRGVTGFVVVRRSVAETTAWASGQAVEVYPIKTGRRRRLAPAENEVEKYEVPMKIYQAPTIDAVIA